MLLHAAVFIPTLSNLFKPIKRSFTLPVSARIFALRSISWFRRNTKESNRFVARESLEEGGWLTELARTFLRNSRFPRLGGGNGDADLSRENARHECGTLWCVRGTVVRTLHGSMGSTLEPPWRLFHVHVSPRVRYIPTCVCAYACKYVRAPVAHPRAHVGVLVFVCVQREREREGGSRGIGRTKGDG